jgi:hypothetical protein
MFGDGHVGLMQIGPIDVKLKVIMSGPQTHEEEAFAA